MNFASALVGAVGLSPVLVACHSPANVSRGGTAPATALPSAHVPAAPSASAAAAPEGPLPEAECLPVSPEEPRPLFSWDPRGSRLAGFFYGKLIAWNLTEGTVRLMAHSRGVRHLAWQAQGALVATTPHSWFVLDPATGALITERELGRGECDAAPTLDPGATRVAYAVDVQGTIEIGVAR